MAATTIRRTKRVIKNRYNATEPEHELHDHATGEVHTGLTLHEARNLQTKLHAQPTQPAQPRLGGPG